MKRTTLPRHPVPCLKANVADDDLNDDQEAYTAAYNTIGETRVTDLNSAYSDWDTLRTDTLANDDTYQGYLSDITDAQSDYSTYNSEVNSLNTSLNSKIVKLQLLKITIIIMKPMQKLL